MNKTIQLLLATTLVCSGQEFTKGYNAIQAGYGQAVVRTYTNVGMKTDTVHVNYQGMNEASNGYFFGRESLRIGKNGLPVDAIAVTRLTGSLAPKLLDTAYGARFAMPKKKGLYGYIDALKHTGIGISGYRGLESVVFAGKEVKGWNFETTQAFKQGRKPFSEVEVLTPALKKHIKLRGFARYDSPKDLTFGLQRTF